MPSASLLHPTDPSPLPLAWRPGYAALGEAFSVPVRPTPLPQLHWVACNDVLRHALGLPEDFWDRSDVLAALGGNAVLPGSTPQATVYSGHQFGVWAGQLGDGRALSLGTLDTPLGAQELQLKGAGLTPYSRMGDGRAVLRSSLREYLCSEAMWGLGIPTTRALCVIGSPAAVRRESIETAAVVTRVAPGFARFGHVEHFARPGDADLLWSLIDHLVEHHLTDLQALTRADRPAALLRQVAQRTAELIADWQAVGFCHGVMNTDNMSLLGLTLDYGPFQFLDGFDFHHVCNHSDTQGRYAYGRQPQVAYWNLYCLAQAMRALLPSQQDAVAALETFKTVFPQALDTRMNAKLGLADTTGDVQPGDRDLQDDLLALLHEGRVDWTVFWRRLGHAVADTQTVHAFEPVRDLFPDRAAWDAWCARYRTRLGDDSRTRAAAGQRMLRTNPKFVLRNHLGELAIRDARAGDFRMTADLLSVLQRPFDEHPEHEDWAGLAPEWASSIEISCSS